MVIYRKYYRLKLKYTNPVYCYVPTSLSNDNIYDKLKYQRKIFKETAGYIFDTMHWFQEARFKLAAGVTKQTYKLFEALGIIKMYDLSVKTVSTGKVNIPEHIIN